MTRYDKFKGFGAEHTAEVWADLLNISFRLFKYYVEEQGKTVEEIYAWYGVLYRPPRSRKNRMGPKMEGTQQRMFELLRFSGYVGPDDHLWDVEVKAVDKHGNHKVSYKGSVIGLYNYRDGGLKLSGCGGIPTWSLEWEDALVVQGPDGLWNIHPHTQKLLAEKYSDEVEKRSKEWKPRESYKTDTNYRRTERTPRGKTYEGLGKQYTVSAWAWRIGVDERTLRRRLDNGETIDEIIESKKQKK